MRALARRLSDLEGRGGPDFPQRWHRVIVDGQSEEQAIADYEAEHGPIGQDRVWVRSFVDPPIG